MLSSSDRQLLNSLYDKRGNEDVFEEYFHKSFLSFVVASEKHTQSFQKENVAQIVNSGFFESSFGFKYTDPIYRSCTLGNKMYSTWSSSFRGQITSPNQMGGKSEKKNKNVLKQDHQASLLGPINKPKKLSNGGNFFNFMSEFGAVKEQDTKTRTNFINQSQMKHADYVNKSLMEVNENIRQKQYENGLFQNNPSKFQYIPATVLNPNKLQFGGLHDNTRRIFCRFCFKNREPQLVFGSHEVKAADGTVTCPILRRYICDLCGATGAHAHTRKYCPLYGSFVNGQYRKLTKTYL